MSEAVTDGLQRIMSMPTEEERTEAFERAADENRRIEGAIDHGLFTARGYISPKKQEKVRSLVLSALDALPYGSGALPLTEADLKFAEGFAHTLATDWAEKKNKG